MIKNYFKIAWRNIKKNKFFSILNIFGLSISLCIALLLLAFANKELSFDRLYSKADRIYRVIMKTSAEYNEEKWITMPNSVGPAIKADVSGISTTARVIKDDFGAPASIRVGEDNFVEKRLYLADSSLFSMFDFQFIEGDRNTVFKEKKSIVLSRSNKEKLFGDMPAMDQLISINQRDTLRVTGVYEDLPVNSTLDCEMIYNIMDSWMGQNVYWSNASYETYVLLQPNVNAEDIETQATSLIDKYVTKENQYFTAFFLQPLAKIHLHSNDLREGYTSRVGNIKTVNTLLFLSGLIILIACINYMNLATARTSKNAKEVGINKVLGAKKTQITLRFYFETFIITLISIVIGYLLSLLILPIFNQLSGAGLSLSDLLSYRIIIAFIICWVAVSLLSGSFPALYMSRISTLILMGKGGSKSSFIEPARKGLVVFQFVSSIVLIISVIVMMIQLKYVQDKDLGYNPEEVLAVSIKSLGSKEKYDGIFNAIDQLPSTISLTASQSLPGDGESGKRIFKRTTDNQGLPISTNTTNGPITETLGLKLLAGNDLPKNISKTDTSTYMLINEVVAKYLGFNNPQDAIGKITSSEMGYGSIITGVVADFNFRSLKEDISGYVYYRANNPSERARTLLIRYKTGSTSAYLKQVEEIFKNQAPESAFDFTFLDSYVQNQYSSIIRTNNIIITFSILSIAIACLGLLGLAAFTAEQRKKEIGIRKVLGANVYSITSMLSLSFLKLVFVAFIIASPLAWYLMNLWLNDFNYRIEIPWWAFGLAALLSLMISGITISFQTIKAAIVNPVDSLRDE